VKKIKLKTKKYGGNPTFLDVYIVIGVAVVGGKIIAPSARLDPLFTRSLGLA